MTRRFEATIEVDAGHRRLWNVMRAVERWPQWAPNIKEATRLDPGPIREGARTRIRQPMAPPAVWTVTHHEDGRGFDWEMRSLGLRARAGHWIRGETEAGEAEVELFFEISGWFGRLLGLVLGPQMQGAVEAEARGLKKRAESSTPHRAGETSPPRVKN